MTSGSPLNRGKLKSGTCFLEGMQHGAVTLPKNLKTQATLLLTLAGSLLGKDRHLYDYT